MAQAFKVGGNVDSWCGRCKLILAHTIEALDNGTPARLHCNTCRQQHGYKPYKPGESPAAERRKESQSGPSGPRAGVAKPSHYQELMKGRNPALSKRYSPKDSYVVGDVVEHATFGMGVTTALKDGSKVEILFPEGAKVLVHGR